MADIQMDAETTLYLDHRKAVIRCERAMAAHKEAHDAFRREESQENLRRLERTYLAANRAGEGLSFEERTEIHARVFYESAQ